MRTQQRITEARVAELAQLLTERDLAVVQTLDTVRIATAAQLERLHFKGAGNGDRQARRRLERLVALRLLARLERRIGGVRAGSAGYVYSLDVAGQRLASACGPAGGSRLRRPWTPGPAFVAHALAVTELYVGLAAAAQEDCCELLYFEAEPRSWRRYSGVGGARAVLKPDAFVRLGVGAWDHAFFVELDRATQAATTIARKLAAYRRYWQTGREQARRGMFPQVLLLVPHEARRELLAEVAAKQPAEVWPLFRVVTTEQAVAAMTERREP